MHHAASISSDSEAPPLVRPFLLGALLCTAFALVWVLLFVRPPAAIGPGLDASWRFAITAATHDHLQFGRDIVFTYGPLGYVLIGDPDVQLARSAAAIALGLALATAVGPWLVFAGRGSVVQKIAFGLGLLCLAAFWTVDYLAFAGILALLARAGRLPRAAPWVGAIVGAVGAFGLLSKFTLGIDVIAVAGVAWLVHAVRGPRRRRQMAFTASAVAVAVAAVVLLLVFRGSPAALVIYLRGAVAITSGYSDAMALPGPAIDILSALAAGAAIGAVGIAVWREGKPAVAAIAVVALFLSWKHGFVRQDGHVMAYFVTAAVVAPIAGVTVRRPAAGWIALGASVLAFVVLFAAAGRWMPGIPPLLDVDRIGQDARYLAAPRSTTAALISDERLAADALSPALLRQIGSATANALPSELAIVPANRLHFAPLPVVQGYSAYTTGLDALNRDALVAHGADYIFYRYEAIDERLPFGETPALTTEMLCRYRALAAPASTHSYGDFVLLRRVPNGRCTVDATQTRRDAVVGAPIAVPAVGPGEAFVTASFRLRPSLLERVRSLLWRAPPVWLEIRYADGSAYRRRLVPGTAADGMVLSAAPVGAEAGSRYLRGGSTPAVTSALLDIRHGAYTLDEVTFTRLRREGW